MESVQEKFNQLINQAIEAMHCVDPAPTQQYLQEAMRLVPESALPPFLLAANLAQTREYDRAEGAYIHALQLQPDFAVARFQLGLLQLTSGRPAAAFSTWVPLSLLGDEHPLCLFAAGLIQMAQDRFETAKDLLRRGIERNADNPFLNQDMTMVINRIAAAEQANGATPRVEQSPLPEEDRSGSVRFMLSQYRKDH